MPKIDITKAPVRTGTNYPEQFRQIVRGREKCAIGDLAGLTQFGVNVTTLKPGSASSARHWHEQEDELVYVLEGELVLVEDGGEVALKAGEAAGFKAGVPNGHHLINKSDRDARYLEIGTRAVRERSHYSDVDLAVTRDESGKAIFTNKSGQPY